MSIEQPDQEPVETAPAAIVRLPKGTSGRKSFSRLRRELTDEELASPAVQRMLLDEVEKLDDRLVDESQYREKYHEADKKLATLQEKFKSKIVIEILHVTCIAIGGVAVGYATSNWTIQPVATLALVVGGVLLFAGVVAKAVKP